MMATRKKKLIIGTNTKMTKNIAETINFIGELNGLTQDIDRQEMTLFVIPSYTSLESARKSVGRDSILLGAQNMSWADHGAFTGEISPIMLQEVGTDIIEIGHSERRHILGETDEVASLKVKTALKNKFIALLCIGETIEHKNLDISDEIMAIQLKTALKGVSKDQAKAVWVAYEPVWAIGENGIPATPKYADERHHKIKQVLIEIFGDEIGMEIPVLYGGSVNHVNAVELIAMPNIDGLFIGRSAWTAKNFNEIIRDALEVFRNKVSCSNQFISSANI